jgi:hypothetical protein
MVLIAISAIGAMLMGMKTLETTNRLEQATSTLSKIVCQDQNATIEWDTLTLYCKKENKITQIDLITGRIGS